MEETLGGGSGSFFVICGDVFLTVVSDLGGVTPFIFSIPSTLTITPSGGFSVFSFFPISGSFEQDKRETYIKKQIAKIVNNFLFLIIKFSLSPLFDILSIDNN